MAILNLWGCVSLFSLGCGLVAFVGKRKHLLNALLSLEFIMVSTFWLMFGVVDFLGAESYFMMFFLTLVACEGALGLALLVSIVRSHGNDGLSSFNILRC
uniref:NADH-ubiquinone oxidoreductase chain 4L n=1 Tax=Palaemon sinensis TaxID=349473 RepID=A0A7U1BG29_9EUCA|nr:NADH dehydrogenase subunit 4L [Palaemon sinensis]